MLNINPTNDAGAYQAAPRFTRAGGLILDGSDGNVACKDQANTFTPHTQTFDGGANIRGNYSVLGFWDPIGPADGKFWQIMDLSGELHFRCLNDAGAVIQAYPLALQRNGGIRVAGTITERARSVAIGEWIPFSPSFVHATINTIYASEYMLIGKTMWISLYVVLVFSGAAAPLMGIPGGFTSASYSSNAGLVGASSAMYQTAPSNNNFHIYQNINGNIFPAGTYSCGVTAAFRVL